MADMNALTLAGKRAVVTGAGRGMGRSIALALAQAGADVGLAARTRVDLEAVAAEVRGMGRRVAWTACDVTDPEQVSSMAAALLGELGGVDILVNNAGSAVSHKFAGHPDDLWDRMLLTNLTSVYY